MLGVQIVTGIVLAMHYVADADLAFESVEKIMRDVNYGWLLRYMHANGASMFFLAVYIHIFRGLYYGSYKAPREVLWILGVHHLPPDDGDRLHGLRAALGPDELLGRHRHHQPVLGDPAGRRGDHHLAVGRLRGRRPDAEPLLLAALPAAVHDRRRGRPAYLGAARRRATNPTGVEVKSKQDAVPFTPHATMKDAFSLVLFLILFAWFVFYHPNYLGHPDNYIQANPLVTPAHIVPEWYFLPFYAILRAIPDKLVGVIAMFGAIAVLFLVPWLDTSRVRSANYRPLYRQFFWIFVVVVHRARLSRLAAAGRRLRHRRAHPDRLLFPPLPGHPAAARPVRDAEAAPGLHRRSRARPGAAARPAGSAAAPETRG